MLSISISAGPSAKEASALERAELSIRESEPVRKVKFGMARLAVFEVRDEDRRPARESKGSGVEFEPLGVAPAQRAIAGGRVPVSVSDSLPSLPPE